MFYISQINSSDCGFASLKMLLANVSKNEDYLYLKQDENHGPYNYFELIDIAKDYGFMLVGLKLVDKDEFEQWDSFPFICTININEVNHAIVVLKRRKKKVYILDPDRGPMWIKLTDFLNSWDSTILKVEEVKESEKKPKNSLKKFENLKFFKFGAQIFQLALSISFLCFLFFVGTSYSPYVAITFFFIYMIGEIVFRQLMLKYMSKFDLIMIEEVKELPKDNYLFLNRLNECKKNLFTSKISIVSNVILVASIIFMMIFNGLQHSITVFLVIALCLFDSLIIKPYLSKKEYVISKMELDINKSTSIDAFKNNFSSIVKSSNAFGKEIYLIKSLKNVLIVLCVSAVLLFSKQISVITILFYTMVSLYLSNGVTSLFDNSLNEKQKRLAKAKFNNLMDGD